MGKSFAIIGAGLIGLATAIKLRNRYPNAIITVWEKEPEPGQHQSTHNSGVLHAGLYYQPGSLKAILSVKGIREMTSFCRQHDIPHEICGKIVVATSLEEELRLNKLLTRGAANGLKGLRLLDKYAIRKIDPFVAGRAALLVPEEGIVDYSKVVTAMRRVCEQSGVIFHFGAPVHYLNYSLGTWHIATSDVEKNATFLVNCAGLHSDRIARLAGEKPETRIVPFRGEYFRLRADFGAGFPKLVYPVPDPQFPFLGVHFTRLITGGVEAGPNAVLALSREGYSKWDIKLGDLAEAITFSGLHRFILSHSRMCLEELKGSFSKQHFCQALQRLVPDVQIDDLEPGGAGVRAQAMTQSGALVQDFSFIKKPNALHVINAPSPGATASLAIGDTISLEVQKLVS